MISGNRGTHGAAGEAPPESWVSALRKAVLVTALAVGAVGTLCDGTKNIGFGLRGWGIGELVAAVLIMLVGVLAFVPEHD